MEIIFRYIKRKLHHLSFPSHHRVPFRQKGVKNYVNQNRYQKKYEKIFKK
jgi:hypothetical protein